MATFLLCSTPVHGHVGPMLEAARHLVRRGHEVEFVTGSRFADRVAAVGATFRPLQGIADFDDRDVDSYLPDRDAYKGLAQAQYDIQTIFVKPIPDQARSVRAAMADTHFDAVLVDGAFGGVVPLLFADGPRPAVLALGVNPLTQSSRDVAPAGTALPPSSSPFGRLRNRALNLLARRVLFRQTQKLGESIFADLGIPHTGLFVMDISGAYDRFLQLCVPDFDYPRSDLAPNTTFVGPMPIEPNAESELPAWWSDLDGTRPVVHVTQGTIDNHDFSRLIRPTLTALAELDVLVVVSLGGPDPAVLGEVPANARIAAYLPYDRLLPLTSVFVTNGGYGGVQLALRDGVPMVVAGGTEDKPEVAARVAHAGVGVDLRTGTPTAAALRKAVQQVLDDSSYRNAALTMSRDIASYDTLATIEEELATASPRAPASRQ